MAKVLLICAVVLASFVGGIFAGPMVRKLIAPRVSACEELASRCKRAEAAGDLKMSLGCGLLLMSGELTEAKCRRLCDKLDRAGKYPI